MKKVTFRIVLDIEGEKPETLGVGAFRFSEEMLGSVHAKSHPEENLKVAREVMKHAFEVVRRDLFEPLDKKQSEDSADIFRLFAAYLFRV